MTATFEAIIEAAMQLSPDERCRVAASLWDSTGNAPASRDPDELESLIEQRDVELDQDPSLEVPLEDFLSHFNQRRNK